MSQATNETVIESTPARSSGRLTLAIVLGPFLGNLIMLAPPPFFPLISVELGISIPLLGQIMTGMLLLSASLALVAGPLADRYGRRRLLLIGAGAASASLIAFGLSPGYPALIAAGLIGGLATATLPGLSVAEATASFSGADRRRALGWSSSAGAGSAVIGVPVLVALASPFGWRVALIVAGIAALGAVWVIARAIPGPVTPAGDKFRLASFGESYRPLLRDTQSLKVLSATILRTICWSGYLTYLSAFMHQRLGLSVSQISVMFFIGGLAYIGASLNTRRLLARVRLRTAVALGNGGMALLTALVLSGMMGYWSTLALIPLTGIAAGIGWVSIVTLMAEESPAEPGTTMALNASAFNIGAAAGGGIGGLTLALGGFAALGAALMCFAVVAALLVALPARRPVSARLA